MHILSQIMTIFGELDNRVAQFQRKTGLRCEPGCGVCCHTGRIYTTVVEMLPAAVEILAQNKAEYWLLRTSHIDSDRGCLFYRSELSENAAGHCRYYPWRPGMCRLFGFSSVIARNGQQRLAVCKHLRSSVPETVKAALTHIADAPRLTDITALFYGIDPSTGNRFLPIHEALRSAIQRMGLQQQMTMGNARNASAVS